MKIFKFTKLFFAVFLIVVIILSAASSALAQGVVIKGEPDGQNKSTVMDEHFYSGSLEPNFTSDSVSVSTDSYGLHFAGAYHYGSALVLTAYKLKSYNKFTFSVDMLKSNDGFIYCGFGGENPQTTVPNYDINICFSKNITALYEMGGMETWTSKGSAPLNNALVTGKTTDFAITLERVSGKDFKVTFEILEDGKAITTADYGTVVHLDHDNGHFCMWGGNNEVFELHDFKVYDSKTHIAFSDDFSNCNLTYGDEAVGNSNWHINESRFKRDEVFVSRNAGPEFKKSNDIITAKSKLKSCDKVSKPYEISFKAKLKSLSKNSTFGLFLGAEKSGSLDKATIIGVSGYNGKSGSVNLVKNGKIYDFGDNLIPIDLLNIDDTSVDFESVIYSDHSLDITIGGVKFTFNNVKYDGYWGICNFASDGKSASVVKLSEVKVVENVYSVCAEPDLSNDFGGIKPTPDGFEEYYISDRTYYIGPGVSLRPKGAFTTEPSLYFENSGSYSAFAPRKKYTDFILQFDLKMVSEGANSQWFGINFGKESYASIPDNSTSVSFEYYAWNTKPYTQMTANLCDFENGTRAKKIEGYHFYKDQDTKYNFMIVAKNRTVYVYFKEDSEDISKLGICRAVIPNVNTAGYVSIFGLNGISFDIFNYKLTNIAPEAKKDSAIALRESFNGKNLSDKLAVDGNVNLKNKSLQLSGGNISTKNNSSYYIANFTVLKLNADLSVNFADNKSLILSNDLKKATLNDGGKKKTFDISEYKLSEYKNTQFQLILQYDALSLSAKGVYEPYDKFASTIVEYTFAKPLSSGIFKLCSDNAFIDDMSVYALDNTYKATNVAYKDDPNDTNIWIAKDNVKNKKVKSVNSNKTDKIPTLYIIIYSVIGVVILALFGVIIAFSVKKRGKKQ